MKVDALIPLLLQRSANGGALTFAPDRDFSGRLTLGQIISGRALRTLESGRYVVDFGGHEKVVDSAIPLRPGEVLHGRVVGLGEQVELQRVADPGPAGAVQQPDPALHNNAQGVWDSSPAGRQLADLFGAYRATLPLDAANVLKQQVARATHPHQVAMAGLILAKLGLRPEPVLVAPLARALAAGGDGRMFAPLMAAIELEVRRDGAPSGTAHDALADAVQELLAEFPERHGLGAGAAPGDGSDPGQARARGSEGPADLARRVLNAQTGGSVAHRVGTLPVLVNGRLLEFDVALFEQAGGGAGAESQLRHRSVAFSLDTASLGRVEITVQTAGQHMQVAVSATQSEVTGYLSDHAAELSGSLTAQGWVMDGLSYATRTTAASGNVEQSIVEHMIRPGSVSRLA